MRRHCSFESYDHDLLSQLAREDPVAFENLRSDLIADFIDSQPEKYQRRLRGLQFRVDGIRRLSHTPLAALLKIQALMWDSFLTMNEELQSIVQSVHRDAVTREEATDLMTGVPPACQVVELPRKLVSRNG